MIDQALLVNPWLAIVLSVMVFAIDYYTAIYEARLYYNGVKDWLVYDGLYRLRPDSQAVSARQIITWLILAAGLYAAWWALTQQLARSDVFLLLIGGLVLSKAAEISRQYRQILFFREVRRRGGLQGRVTLTRRLGFMQVVYDWYAFVILYLLLFILTGSWFVLGGALACFVSSRRLRDWTVMKA